MNALKRISSFVVRYKLHHLLFWLVYHYFWWAWSSGSAIDAVHNILFSPYQIKFASYVIFQALGVYFNLYFLIPRFLQRGKYWWYGALFVATVMGTAGLITYGYHLNAYFTGISFEELFGVNSGGYWGLFKSSAIPSTAASMTLAMSIKLTKNWLKSEKRRHQIEKEKLQTELKFLRSQLNPHFLFNTINSIFVLIHKNQDMASDSLAKFSELLRYQLYECNETHIPLERELEYLRNFIELEKLRHTSEQLQIELSMDHSAAGSLDIAPFLLIPFIENAFKHVSNHPTQTNWIRMRLLVNNSNLEFQIANSYQPMQIATDEETSGIGLTNVRRRLELLYPNAHILDVQCSDTDFTVGLQLKLDEVESHKKQSA